MISLACALGLLTLSGDVTIWHIYLITALQATTAAFDLPARQSLTPNLVPADDLPNAFSLQSISYTVGAIIGPASSGLVIAGLGLEYVYFINAITYLAVIVAIIQIGEVPQEIDSAQPTGINRSAITEGVRFVWKQPLILSSMMLDFIATFFSSARALLPIFTIDILGLGEVAYGLLSAAEALGSAATGLVVSQLGEFRRQGATLLWSAVIYGLATILFGFSRLFALSFLALMLIGAADTVSTIIRNTIRQLQTPDRLRGRMTSINQIFFMGGPQLGELEAGLAAQFFGAPFAVISGGIACIISVGWAARRWPQLARYNNHTVQEIAPAVS
jgi:MFS family permease